MAFGRCPSGPGPKTNTADWVTYEQQTLISPQFWKLQVPGQSGSRFCSWRGLSSWASEGHLLTVCSYGPERKGLWSLPLLKGALAGSD